MRRNREELLAHYARRQVTEFVQYDGAADQKPDCAQTPDDDGDVVRMGRTTELMHGYPVRVLVKPDTSPADAARLLRKMATTIEAGGLYEPAKNDARAVIPY